MDAVRARMSLGASRRVTRNARRVNALKIMKPPFHSTMPLSYLQGL